MTAKQWQQQEERGTSFGMRFLLFALSTFGYAVVVVLLYPVVLYFYLTGAKARKGSLAYLKNSRAFFNQPLRIHFFSGFPHHLSFAQSALDRFWFWQSKINRFGFNGAGLQEISRYLDAGQGCLLIGAHMGNFDSLRVLCNDRDIKVNAVMYIENAQRFNNLLKRINPESHLNIINLKDRSIEAVLQLKDCIERGEIVAILADRFHSSSKPRVIFSPFLGVRAPFPANPWLVAGLLECPTFLVAGMKVGHREYESVVQFVAQRLQIRRETREADLEQYIAQYVRFLEQLCRKYPYQWYNFYDFWSSDEC